jgi:biotin carboxyl carrier protein
VPSAKRWKPFKPTLKGYSVVEVFFQNGQSIRLERRDGHFQATVDGKTYQVKVTYQQGAEIVFSLQNDESPLATHYAFVARDGNASYVWLDGLSHTLPQADPNVRRRRTGQNNGGLTAAMTGQVVQVLVAPGQSVARGQTLLLLEAMKMETRVNAPADGVVQQVLCAPGQVVERGAMLIVFAPH